LATLFDVFPKIAQRNRHSSSCTSEVLYLHNFTLLYKIYSRTPLGWRFMQNTSPTSATLLAIF